MQSQQAPIGTVDFWLLP
ncbi:unnamed protein product, partial [Rotaria magnacalcarata]